MKRFLMRCTTVWLVGAGCRLRRRVARGRVAVASSGWVAVASGAGLECEWRVAEIRRARVTRIPAGAIWESIFPRDEAEELKK